MTCSTIQSTLFSVCINLTSLTIDFVNFHTSSLHAEGEAKAGGIICQPRLLAFEFAVFFRDNFLELFPSKAPSLVDLNDLHTLTIKPGPYYDKDSMEIALWKMMTIPKETLHHLKWDSRDCAFCHILELLY